MVGKVLGKVIAVEKWLFSQTAREFYNKCLSIVLRGFFRRRGGGGVKEERGRRFAKMWASCNWKGKSKF